MIIKKRRYLIRLIYLMFDMSAVCLAIYLACLLRDDALPFPVTFSNIFVDPENPFRFIFIFWIFAMMLFLNAQSLYQTRREILEGFEIGKIIKCALFSSLAVMAITYVLKVHGFPRSVLLIGTILMIVFLSIWRASKRYFVDYIVSRGYNNFNALIVGAGKVGTTLAREIRRNPGLGIKVVGFLDDFKEGNVKDVNINIVGKLADFENIAKTEFINKVFITIHHDGEVFMKLLEKAKELGIAVRVVPQGFDLMPTEFIKYNIGIIPVIEYGDEMPFKKQLGKRAFDFMMSLMGFIVLLPVFFVIAVMIKIDSSGPIFYISKRYGRRGRIFNMYKFRSMQKDAEEILDEIIDQNEVDGPIFKMRNDPRITNFGKILRKYSLDELPQIMNVLKGDMSLVGPRPLPIDQIEKEDLNQLKRLEVRPGITGLWQIRGRSDLSFIRLVKWDIWYINNWSFWLDLSILFQTVPVVLKGKGAY
ncbi:MAG: sugar transferase [Candidatus Omnitrophica bacterium]|nr:sugar transferase [Candidatus Omnitrophota bacterium]